MYGRHWGPSGVIVWRRGDSQKVASSPLAAAPGQTSPFCLRHSSRRDSRVASHGWCKRLAP